MYWFFGRLFLVVFLAVWVGIVIGVLVRHTFIRKLFYLIYGGILFTFLIFGDVYSLSLMGSFPFFTLGAYGGILAYEALTRIFLRKSLYQKIIGYGILMFAFFFMIFGFHGAFSLACPLIGMGRGECAVWPLWQFQWFSRVILFTYIGVFLGQIIQWASRLIR